MEIFLELTLETNFDRQLPKPYSVARKLKRKTLQLIQAWDKEFGKDYRQLHTTFVNLKKKLKVTLSSSVSLKEEVNKITYCACIGLLVLDRF